MDSLPLEVTVGYHPPCGYSEITKGGLSRCDRSFPLWMFSGFNLSGPHKQNRVHSGLSSLIIQLCWPQKLKIHGDMGPKMSTGRERQTGVLFKQTFVRGCAAVYTETCSLGDLKYKGVNQTSQTSLGVSAVLPIVIYKSASHPS